MKNLDFIEDGLVKFNYDFPVFNWFYPYDADELTDIEVLKNISSNNIKIFDYLLESENDVALYFHIPFCQDICAFCPFTREILEENEKLNMYVEALLQEIELKREYLHKKNLKINSIFFGGGTPSILKVEHIEKIGKKINESFDLSVLKEFSFEMNAKTVTEDRAKILKKIGVTHVRVGVQTFSERYRELFCLSATLQQINEGIQILKKYFKNVSIDIMYGFNGETIDEFLNDLRNAIKLDVPNISLYPLNNKSIQTRLIENYKKANLVPVSGLDRLGFKIIAKEYLAKNNYYPHNGHDFIKIENQNEIKEFMTDKYMFEYHRTVYGTANSQLIGFGVSAISFFNSFITLNERNIDNYIKNLIENKKCDIIIHSYDKQLDYDKPLALYLPYHGKILKSKVDFNKISKITKQKLEKLIKLNLVKEYEKEYRLSEVGWLSYVNLLYFLSSEKDQKLLIELIEESESRRDIGKWNFKF